MPMVLNKESQRKVSVQLLSLKKGILELIAQDSNLEIQLFCVFFFPSTYLGLSGFSVESREWQTHYERKQPSNRPQKKTAIT